MSEQGTAAKEAIDYLLSVSYINKDNRGEKRASCLWGAMVICSLDDYPTSAILITANGGSERMIRKRPGSCLSLA